jgi:hypothetical protein
MSKKICIYCNVKVSKKDIDNKTKDHVIPRSLYNPSDLTGNAITVLCCRKCNHEKNMLEQKVIPFFMLHNDDFIKTITLPNNIKYTSKDIILCFRRGTYGYFKNHNIYDFMAAIPLTNNGKDLEILLYLMSYGLIKYKGLQIPSLGKLKFDYNLLSHDDDMLMPEFSKETYFTDNNLYNGKIKFSIFYFHDLARAHVYFKMNNAKFGNNKNAGIGNSFLISITWKVI